MSTGRTTAHDRRHLAQALAERDAALEDLARARAELAAVRTSLEWLEELSPPPMPDGVGPGDPPLRYVLADKANEGAKRLLGPLQASVRGLLEPSRRGRR